MAEFNTDAFWHKHSNVIQYFTQINKRCNLVGVTPLTVPSSGDNVQNIWEGVLAKVAEIAPYFASNYYAGVISSHSAESIQLPSSVAFTNEFFAALQAAIEALVDTAGGDLTGCVHTTTWDDSNQTGGDAANTVWSGSGENQTYYDDAWALAKYDADNGTGGAPSGYNRGVQAAGRTWGETGGGGGWDHNAIAKCHDSNSTGSVDVTPPDGVSVSSTTWYYYTQDPSADGFSATFDANGDSATANEWAVYETGGSSLTSGNFHQGGSTPWPSSTPSSSGEVIGYDVAGNPLVIITWDFGTGY